MALPFDWIDKKNFDQLEWMDTYLKRKSLTKFLPRSFTLLSDDDYHSGMIEKLLKAPNDAEHRELSRQMKGAWRTNQYRKNSGKQVSFQLSHCTLDQLDNLAKKYGQPKVQFLSQIISDVASYQKIAEEQSRAEQAKWKAQLKKQQEAVQTYGDVVDRLLYFLMGEIDQRCELEVHCKKLNNFSQDDTPLDERQVLIEKSLSELEPILEILIKQRLKFGLSLSQRMQEKNKSIAREHY